MNEIDPASDWCQRWHDRSHSWRHKSEGGFDPDNYTVEPIEETVAKGYVLRHHYSGSYPSAIQRYGLFTDDRLVGVAVLSYPVQNKVLTNVLPALEPGVESLELGRFVLHDECPGNSESWFLGQVFREAATRGLRGIVSFSDPVPRKIDGRIIFGGHVGLIYAATNARYTGRATARSLVLLPGTGKVLNERAISKVRNRERGHEHVERELVALGARPLREGDKANAWLREALDDIGATRLRHGGNHRYAFALGTKAERRRLEIAHPPLPYPKRVDAA